jgi:hypothetical protein
MRAPSPSVAHATEGSACGLVAIDIPSGQRFMIVACVTEESEDGGRERFSGKKVKVRDGACRDHVVIRRLTVENMEETGSRVAERSP